MTKATSSGRWIAAAALLVGCGQTAQVVTLRSLESSGRMSFLCLSDRDHTPRDIDDCPDSNPVDDETRHLYTLVTQVTRGEVALVDLTAGAVVDEEPSILGFNFLPIGAQPTAIVSTPGGVATFVSVAEAGKEGIFALPTSCVAPRLENTPGLKDQPVRDITTWPACRLEYAPGDMALIIDSKRQTSCDSSEPTAAIPGRQCPADLANETKVPGQRKLAVAIPERGQIAIVDAQWLLNQKPGSYEPCQIERWVPLQVALPATPVVEQLPPDLAKPGFTFPNALSYGANDPSPPSRPAGFAQLDDPRTGEHRLFVADLDAPVIHDLDISDPCAIKDDEPPLLPASFQDSAGTSSARTGFVGRSVTTKKLAVSPLTTAEQRYLYAIDELGGGTVMIFDVSPGATERTPIVRPNPQRFPFEPAPDRIAFAAPAADVAFAFRDPVAADPGTGATPVGVLCDPDPSIDPESTAAKYRPAPDFTTGANAGVLRGVFGFVALTSGEIAVMDVEDFDAKCRRPIYANPSSTPDFRGCAHDEVLNQKTGNEVPFKGNFTIPPNATPPNGTLTVTNEVTCNVVEPHRARSQALVLNNDTLGNRAPSLRTLPKLIDESGRTLSVDVSPEGLKHPRMLGVNFSTAPSAHAQVYVGTTLLDSASGSNKLDTDPATSLQNSLVLSFVEPRSYAPTEDFSARYEGSLFGALPAGRFTYDKSHNLSTFVDGGTVFCDAGVEDEASAAIRGQGLGVDPTHIGSNGLPDIDTFSEQHADYVSITSALVAQTDSYWAPGGNGSTCGDGGGFVACSALFGADAATEVTPLLELQRRELRIVKATVDTLTVEPRGAPHGSHESATLSDWIACCFPQAVSYEVRASKEWVVRGSTFHHNVITGQGGQCTLDLSPLKSLLPSRVFEVSCDPTSLDCAEGTGKNRTLKSIGPSDLDTKAPPDVACVVQHPSVDTQTIGQGPEAQCIYTGLSGSFVIYRGREVSVRDMEFDWEISGGFAPLSVSLAAGSDPNSTPGSMVFSPELGQLVIADGASKGLVLVDLGTLATTQYY